MKKFFAYLGFLLVIVFSLLYISKYDYILKGITKIYLKGHTTAYLSDYQAFSNHTVSASLNPQPWPIHESYNKANVPNELADYHKEKKTVAFLIFKNDSIFHENYFEGYDLDSKSNSFSMVKSMVSAMLGKAIEEGYIKSLDQLVQDFIPELKGPYASQVTVGDLSSMASGLKWTEKYYSPFSVTSASYFVDDLNGLILDQPIDIMPAKAFNYKSGATQLLGLVIKNATKKSLSDYLTEKFWQPLGAEHDAVWQIDSDGKAMEKAYCCLASNARDFARFGKLYKDHGRWNGKQILDSTFIAKSLKPRFEESPEYGYGWWLNEFEGEKIFMMRGHLGQYVIVLPEKNLMVVRLGHLNDEINNVGSLKKDIFIYLKAALEMTQDVTQN